ncbi:MAG: hypothetical protein HOV92_00680 [Streptomyces sp.]|nr:hypothetical protein [Streptomyces sp.]
MLTFLAGLTPTAAVFLAVSLFSGSLVPFFLLVDADFTALGEWLRSVAGATARTARELARDAAALLILLTTRPTGAMA